MANKDKSDPCKYRWQFAAFGSGATRNEEYNGFIVNDDRSVSVWSVGNSGKLNLPSVDGLSFYYTAIPADEYFSLTARVRIDEWTFTNAQEGFGLMAADRVGRHGFSGSFWNNSIMAACTRVEYYTRPEEPGNKAGYIRMKLGIGAREKTGITPDLLKELDEGRTDNIRDLYSTHMYTLERSCEERGPGIYNLFGNEKANIAVGTVDTPLTEVVLRIRRMSDGYEVSYLDRDKNILGTKYLSKPDALSVLDRDHIYIGFFAARACRVTFSDIELTVSKKAEAYRDELRISEYIYPDCRLLSSTVSNHFMYTLMFEVNADGSCRITDNKQDGISALISVKRGRIVKYKLMLEEGENTFRIIFTPEHNYHPDGDPQIALKSEEPVSRDFTVSFIPPGGKQTLYAAPDGRPEASGTVEAPIDICSALIRVKPGQEIVLMPGRYYPDGHILIEPDVNGVKEAPIVLRSMDGGRAVIDFEKKYEGFTLAGSYWKISGIDCINSAPFSQGMRICGHDIRIEDVRTYDNGETGMVVEAYTDTDTRDRWPHDILIKACMSFNNSDPGQTNADGFAAKVTAGPGIIFDGCISCYNADDGFDLFAKQEYGTIGHVVIKNCIAFRNGYMFTGEERGRGNGFKLGGMSLPGGHYLYNCAAFYNWGIGIDTNTAPDIHINKCVSFNNHGANVGLYTIDAPDTAYSVKGVLSCKTGDGGCDDIIRPKGGQDIDLMVNDTDFYQRDGKSINGSNVILDSSWFVSCDEPEISDVDPITGLTGLIGKEGGIDLGDFLKLSTAAEDILKQHGIKSHDVGAKLYGE